MMKMKKIIQIIKNKARQKRMMIKERTKKKRIQNKKQNSKKPQTKYKSIKYKKTKQKNKNALIMKTRNNKLVMKSLMVKNKLRKRMGRK